VIEILDQFINSPRVELAIPGLSPESLRLNEFAHVATTCSANCDEAGRMSGETAWRCTVGTRIGLVAWDWMEFDPRNGVLIMVNPNHVWSNFRIIDSVTRLVCDSTRTVTLLNMVIHGTSWSSRVFEELKRASLVG
jgi:Domain of unknown function (DUF4902)